MMQTGKIRREGFRNSRGFTLVEIITVLVIIGIITAVVVARSSNNRQEVAAAALADQLLGHIRYAQAQAMNTNTVWGVEMTTHSYRVFSWEGGKHYVSMNAQDQDADFRIKVPAPINLHQTVISFDDLGRPYNNDSATGPVPVLQSDLYFFINICPGYRAYWITPNTGFIVRNNWNICS